jgi:endo-1,4-beta-xylanase
MIDGIVDWALLNGFRVRASHLIWGADEAIPTWLKEGTYTREEYLEILETHVKIVMEHFQGRVAEWSIANEAPSRAFSPGNDFWADNIGIEYIGMAFRWAREADPEAILIFNDANNESPRDASSSLTIDRMYTLLRQLKDDNVPIDVIGMQMHLLLPWNSPIRPTKQSVIETMQRFAELGVTVYITEFDINLQWMDGSQEERWEFQAQLYADMVSACIESGVCTSITFWGVSDSTSWLSCNEWDWCLNYPQSEPLLFDRDFLPKPAYFSILDVLDSLDDALP